MNLSYHMKPWFLLIGLVIAHLAFAQTVEVATSLSPQDFGAHKWVLSGTPQAGEVIVFRVTTFKERNGQATKQIHDEVHYSPGRTVVETIFFLDIHFFDPRWTGEPEWCVRGLESGWINGKFAGAKSRDGQAEIAFESKGGDKTRKVFEAFIQSYADAALTYEGLPPLEPDGGWGWSGEPMAQR